MEKFTCERFGEFRHFDSFEECRRFVRREGDASRLWSYLGAARALYEASL